MILAMHKESHSYLEGLRDHPWYAPKGVEVENLLLNHGLGTKSAKQV